MREEDGLRELAYRPIKAAKNDISNSIFNDPVIYKLENIIMRKGKKNLSHDLIHRTCFEIKKIQLKKFNDPAITAEEKSALILDPVEIIKTAIENAKPVVIVRPVKRGGATYQVPHPITANYSRFLSMKWLVESIKERPKPREEPFAPCFARELIAAASHEGKVIKKKHDLHKLCEANKAYAHYRWG